MDYLERFIGKIVFKVDSRKNYDPLERMRVLLNLLDNPQNKFKSVLVGGTSGKGSTAYLISHILTTAGYKTGLTLSPHLQRVNERLQINGKEISDLEFAKLTNSMIRIIELMEKMPARIATQSVAGGLIGGPSYFEILVALAFKYFEEQKVDIAVVEVGMGGEFDATNTLNPLIAVLTNVGLDHTEILGKTVEKIARTKAGIIKMNQESRIMNQAENISSAIIHDSQFMIHPVVSGVRQPTVVRIIEDRCNKVEAKLNLLWRDFGYKIKKENASGTRFDFISDKVNLDDLSLSLAGGYQAENASLAIKTILELEKLGFKISESAIRKALKSAFFAGRFEIVPVISSQLSVVGSKSAGRLLTGKPKTDRLKSDNREQKADNIIILDGAHNPVKMKEFLKSLKKIFPKQNPTSPRLRGVKKIFVIAFKFDKDIKKMLKEIIGVADEIIVTEFKAKTDTNIHASAEALEIKNKILNLKYKGKVAIEKDSKKALKKAIKLSAIEQFNNGTIVVVTGSLYLVGEIRNLIYSN